MPFAREATHRYAFSAPFKATICSQEHLDEKQLQDFRETVWRVDREYPAYAKEYGLQWSGFNNNDRVLVVTVTRNEMNDWVVWHETDNNTAARYFPEWHAMYLKNGSFKTEDHNLPHELVHVANAEIGSIGEQEDEELAYGFEEQYFAPH